ncbi:hypothetical protein AVEN_103539-1 [Araneus ventricosus]|uniref:Uncharacterized protein n=1 Tax=Araneus ventricosus TaxID=182803 RepID=A0A4Y2JKE1_ARAVE|nr:hypothetical protein AVEN_103539-1 [Araneus ventricosus]
MSSQRLVQKCAERRVSSSSTDHGLNKSNIVGQMSSQWLVRKCGYRWVSSSSTDHGLNKSNIVGQMSPSVVGAEVWIEAGVSTVN